MVHREAFIDNIESHSKSMAAMNRLVTLYEHDAKGRPEDPEVEDMKGVIHKLYAQVKRFQKKEADQAPKLKEWSQLKDRVSQLEASECLLQSQLVTAHENYDSASTQLVKAVGLNKLIGKEHARTSSRRKGWEEGARCGALVMVKQKYNQKQEGH